jgi:hypothetical protein
MQEKKYKKTKIILGIIIFGSIIILLDLCSLLIQQNRYVDHLDHVLDMKSQSLITKIHTMKRPATANDAILIQGWMTFDYVNHLFALPANYLQTSIIIMDRRYPQLSIAEYAEDTHTRQTIVLEQVQTAVRNYFSQNQ